MTATTEFPVKAFAEAYVAGNKVAQCYDPAKPGFRCAYEIAADLGYARDTLEWEAAVGGAAAYFINGHRF